jgi:hypothetical protein
LIFSGLIKKSLTLDAHKYGAKRMLQSEVIPITLESLVSEWMHDWSNPNAGELVKEVYSKSLLSKIAEKPINTL